MYSISSTHQKKVVRLKKTLRPSWIQQNYQVQWQRRQLLSPPSSRWSHASSHSIRTPVNRQFPMCLAVNIQLCHPASMNSSCHPTHPMCWLPWPWSERMRNTAPSHRSYPSRLQFRRPNECTIEGWEATHTTTDDATFYTDDEPRQVYWDISSTDTFDSNEPGNVSVSSSPSSTPPRPRRQKKKLSTGISFPKKMGVSQHTCEAWGQPLPAQKTPWRSGKTPISNNFYQTLTITITCILTVVHIYGFVYNTYPYQCTYTWVRIYPDPNWSGLGRNRYVTNKYS